MNPQYYWFQAFVIVIRAGAVVPMVVVEEGNNSPPAARESPAGQSSLSSGGMMLRNLSSIDTPPVILGNALSSGIMISRGHSEEPDDCDRIVERKYYGNLRLDSSPSRIPLANALSPTDHKSSKSSTSAGEGERSDLSLFSGMDAITEEPDEEE
jgi:hypothetical protein